ncbi:MAG: hypothetical protein JSW53_02680, partial [Candidatus Bathyarchaeota archaeon]
MRIDLKRWAPVFFFSGIIIILVIIWHVTFPPEAWEDTPNYLQMYVNFVVTRPADAFLTVGTGARGTVAWVFIPVYSLMAIHIILYVVGSRRNQQYTIVNRNYLIYLVILGLFAISFQNA